MSEKADFRRNVRSRLAHDLEGSYEKIWTTLSEAMDSSKEAWVSCEKCGKRNRVQIPDTQARVRAIEIALSEGFGKRSAEEKLPPKVNLGKRIEEMTDEELDAIIDGTVTLEEVTA
jgi:hypothetical protein